MPEPPVESSLQRLLESQKKSWDHCGVPSEVLSTRSAIVNRPFFPVCRAGLLDGSQRDNISKYVALVVEGNAEDPNKEKVLMDAKHVRFFSHWARLRPLLQRGLNLAPVVIAKIAPRVSTLHQRQ